MIRTIFEDHTDLGYHRVCEHGWTAGLRVVPGPGAEREDP